MMSRKKVPQRSHKLPTISVRLRFENLDGPYITAAPHNSFELRDLFLGLKTDEEFSRFNGVINGCFDNGPLRSVDFLRQWQRLIHVLSKTPRQRWTWRLCHRLGFEPRKFEMATTAHDLRIYWPARDGAPADIVSHCALDAMLDAIHIEKSEGYAIRCCALPECLRTFQRRTAHKMLYCTPEHASLATTRRWRRKVRRVSNRN
jgi:hypothetical protein